MSFETTTQAEFLLTNVARQPVNQVAWLHCVTSAVWLE